jgi:flagellar basal body-associated protein FliL
MALTVKNKSSETSKTILGEFSMMTLLILIIIVIIVAAVVGAGVAAAMKPKNPPPGMREIDREPKTMPRPPPSTRGPAKKAREPVACANCGYAIEPDEHLTACKSCNAPFHDDCAQTGTVQSAEDRSTEKTVL